MSARWTTVDGNDACAAVAYQLRCNKCALVCPHAAIRVKVYPAADLEGAPATFKHVPFKGTDLRGDYTVQVAPEDCTGLPPLVLDSPPPKADVGKLMAIETRFQVTDQRDHEHYEELIDRARHQIAKRVALYHELARAQ